ncbi:AAA family ATPase [Clostridium sp. D2Q-11]|uniref:AAA family ATPase n=1 Tax=Anaeromonas frigoriresistens TaxID=2683708 RepID=A0A942UX96_9FIRM|nr:AAA family ATPase [Anaeromonas frigoriresistens]MBS4539260.1 AAA family ATPase [Anaeromonas frigoriresistens]
MIIEELIILSFGKFNGKNIKLSDGLNLIYGDNEAGKSTIHKFIEGMLYGFNKKYTKTKRYTEDYEKYFPWNNNQYKGVLKYSYDNEIYRIERNFEKGNDEVAVFDEETGEELTHMYEYNPVARVIEPTSLHFGINKSIYQNTISIAQLESKTDSNFAKEVKDNLINLGGTLDNEISIKNVIERLEKRINDIGTKNRLKTSPYGKIIEELNKLSKQRDKSHKMFEETKEFQYKINELKKELNELVRKKDKLEKDIYKYRCKEINDKYIKAKGLLKEIDSLHKQSYKLRRFKDIKIKDYGDIIKHENSVETIVENMSRIEENISLIQQKLDDVNSQLDQKNILIENINYKEKLTIYEKLKNKKKINKLLLLFSTISIVIGLVLGYSYNYIFYFLSVFMVFSDLYLVIKTKSINCSIIDKKVILDELENEKIKKNNELRDTERFLQNQLLEKNTEIQRLKTKLNEENMGIKFILSKNKFDDVDELKLGIEKKRLYEEIINRINYQREILSNILMKETIEELEEKMKECNKVSLDDIDIEEDIVEKLNVIKENIVNKDKEISNLEEKINTMNSLFRPIQEIDEEISIKQEMIDKYENELNSIEIAKATIEKISKNIHRDFAPKLNKKVSQIISDITHGKYKEIKITENLEMKIVDQNNNLIDIESLSYGTIDQIYFSLRFGIIDIIKEDKNIPLILDDCFIQYDDQRLSNILDYIYEQSMDRQIILFTCQKREQKILNDKKYSFNYIEI